MEKIGISDILAKVGFDKEFEELIRRGFQEARKKGPEFAQELFSNDDHAEFVGFYLQIKVQNSLQPFDFTVAVLPVVQYREGYRAIQIDDLDRKLNLVHIKAEDVLPIQSVGFSSFGGI